MYFNNYLPQIMHIYTWQKEERDSLLNYMPLITVNLATQKSAGF